MNWKPVIVATVEVYRRSPGKVRPAGYGSSMPVYLYEAGDYGPAIREERLNPDTGRKYETTVADDVRMLPTAREIADADAVTMLVNAMPEADRRLIWLYGAVKTSKRRTFTGEARKMGVTRHKLSAEIDKAFKALAGTTRSNVRLLSAGEVATGPGNQDNDATIGHENFFRGFTKLEAETAGPVDYSKFMKRA
jgi:hypothetical protein